MSGTYWTEEDIDLLGLLNTALNLPTWATAKLLNRSKEAVMLKRYTEDMPRPTSVRRIREREIKAQERHRAKARRELEEADAREAASLLPGIEVRRHKWTWHFVAILHTTDGRHKRYAGKDIHRAIALRSELVAAFSKRRMKIKLAHPVA